MPGRIHVLTLTPFYPFAVDDAFGCFVAEPLQHFPTYQLETSTFAVRPFYRARPRANPSAPPAVWCSFAALPGGSGLAGSGRLLFWRLRAKVRELHRRNRIDLIHAHSALPCGRAAMLLARALRIPFVVSVHGLDAFSTRQVKGMAGERCRHQSDEVYRAAQAVICVSRKVREQVLAGVSGPVSAEVVYNGVDPEMFFPPRTREESDPFTILSVGDVIPTKGQELVLRALAAIREKIPQVQYEIIGDGPQLLSLRRLAAQLNIDSRVSFLGRRSRTQVAEAMRRCTILALPSSYEGLGCVYLEAMATGKPVIGCRGQGIEEIIRHRENGWLVEDASVEEVTRALLCLLENRELREKIGSEARPTVLHQFTLAHQAEELNRVYRDGLR